jgi:hypothetical protein
MIEQEIVLHLRFFKWVKLDMFFRVLYLHSNRLKNLDFLEYIRYA